MVESKQDKIFNTKVIPIMNKVRNDLQNKLADELRSNSNSFAGLMENRNKECERVEVG